MRLVCSVRQFFKVTLSWGLLFLAESWHERALTCFVRNEERDKEYENHDASPDAEHCKDVFAIKLCRDRFVRAGF